MTPLTGIALVLALLGALMLSVYLLRRRLSPEMSRKTVHIGMGLTCLAFPWLFADYWPVILLAGLSIALLIAVRWAPRLNRRFGKVLGGVERISFGEIYFPIAVAAVFVWSRHQPLLYVVPILLLTLADSCSALIGQSYGKFKYSTLSGKKSWEGSLTFFMVAFLCVHVPVLLFSDIGRAESLLIATMLALLLMLAEAASWRGLDNLFIPLAACGLLQEYWPLPASLLLFKLALLAAVLMLALYIRHRLLLDGGAIALATIACYTCAALAGITWLIAPLTVLFGYAAVSPATWNSHYRSVDSVLCIAVTGFFWVFLAKGLDAAQILLFPFTLCLAVHFAIVSTSRLARDYPYASPARLIARGCTWSVVLLLLPYFAIAGFELLPFLNLLLGAALIYAGVHLFWHFSPDPRNVQPNTPRWLRQGGLAWSASLFGCIPAWAISSIAQRPWIPL